MGEGTMPPKNKNKKAAAAAKKKEEEELARQEQIAVEDDFEFQKTCLEIRIKELETLNLGLQRKSEYLQNQNDVYQSQIQDIRQEKDDLVSHLERSYSAEKTNVKELEDRLFGTYQAMLQERAQYEQRLVEKDQNLKETEEKFTKQVIARDAKIISYEEFRIQKDKLTMEKDELKQTLEEERDRFIKNYNELENNLIRYRERIKNESVVMVKKMANDVQKAGKLCLTATVKSAISENIRLQDELETTSRDNLRLRGMLEELEQKLREQRMTVKVLEEENGIFNKKCSQYRSMTEELLDRQILMQQQLQRSSEMENEFINLKTVHALCPSENEIRLKVEENIRIMLLEEELQEKQTRIDPKDLKISKMETIILQLALAAKSLSNSANAEEIEFYKQTFKKCLVETFNFACAIPNLEPEILDQLGVNVPSITPCISLVTPKK